MVWYSHLLKNFPVCCDPVKGFVIVNKSEVDIFLELFFILFFFPDSIQILLIVYCGCVLKYILLENYRFEVIVTATKLKVKHVLTDRCIDALV